MYKLPELLCPAGDMKSLEAAIEGGADAVYFAGKSFGARNFADNFNADELKKYKELLDSGVISQEEFDTKKKQLLGL